MNTVQSLLFSSVEINRLKALAEDMGVDTSDHGHAQAVTMGYSIGGGMFAAVVPDTWFVELMEKLYDAALRNT